MIFISRATLAMPPEPPRSMIFCRTFSIINSVPSALAAAALGFPSDSLTPAIDSRQTIHGLKGEIRGEL